MKDKDEQRRWLALALLPYAGPQFWQHALDRWVNPETVLQSSSATLKAMGLREPGCAAVLAWQRRLDNDLFLRRIDEAEAVCAGLQVQLIAWTDPRYPPALRQIHGPPIALFVRGDAGCLGRRQIALVGSRRATRDGLDNARQFARALAARGLVVTSGLAMGIDGAAHEGALNGQGVTVAVLGTGIDTIYPAQHRQLAERIVDGGGALVAEMPPGTPPRAGHFPRRNRIISGLSQGVLVVEASPASGSLITARLALEQGREVFAIPGSIHNPQARGCHGLIQAGARLVETVDDIAEELGPWDLEPVIEPQQPDPDEIVPPAGDAGLVWAGLGFDPRDTDDLANATGLEAGRLLQALLELELNGQVESTPAGYRRLPAQHAR